jgi:hypothetical protein
MVSTPTALFAPSYIKVNELEQTVPLELHTQLQIVGIGNYGVDSRGMYQIVGCSCTRGDE